MKVHPKLCKAVEKELPYVAPEILDIYMTMAIFDLPVTHLMHIDCESLNPADYMKIKQAVHKHKGRYLDISADYEELIDALLPHIEDHAIGLLDNSSATQKALEALRFQGWDTNQITTIAIDHYTGCMNPVKLSIFLTKLAPLLLRKRAR
ncbi:MAG: hypothetical protein KatS3mg054_0005 [Chloroflexus sp.]|nr:MAG: hypothetical protein KatS3mg054_0005 [Chloroflexus sp.]